MGLTRRHFVRLAEILKSHAEYQDRATQSKIKMIAIDVAVMCKIDNPQFNTSKFLEASGFHPTDVAAFVKVVDRRAYSASDVVKGIKAIT